MGISRWKVENTETFEEAMARELYEEIGIRINIKNLKSLDILNHSYDKKNYYDELVLFK